jgi:hypothetical protein
VFNPNKEASRIEALAAKSPMMKYANRTNTQTPPENHTMQRYKVLSRRVRFMVMPA